MWLRLAEEFYIPYNELVGFFSPEALGAPREGKTRSVVLLRDGRAIPTSTGLRTLEKKIPTFFSHGEKKVAKKSRG